MTTRNQLARQFEVHRPKMRAVACRLLGSSVDAEDAVQEAWVRLDRSDVDAIENLEAWLMTTVGRIALNGLRTRANRREMPLDNDACQVATGSQDPELEVLLDDAVGTALQIVLDTLTPAERVAYVLHDTFALPFTEVSRILERSPEATRQLASRARRRIRDLNPDDGELTQLRIAEQEVVQAFLKASREGQFTALLNVLDPDVIERVAIANTPVLEVYGADAVASRAKEFSLRYSEVWPAWVNGWPGWITYRDGEVYTVGALSVSEGRISRMDVIMDPDRLSSLSVFRISAQEIHRAIEGG